MKNISTLLVSLMLFLSGSIYAATDLIGSVVPPYPQGWIDEGGSCLEDCDYGLGVLQAAGGGLIFILQKSAPRIDPSKARWTILDTMPYPEAPADHYVAYSLCELNGKPDASIIAVVKKANGEWLGLVKQAFRANLKTGKFEKIPSTGIRCINEAWGL